MNGSSSAVRTYLIAFGMLIVLTLLTVALSFFQLGSWHLTVGLGIGAVKAAIVGLFFMHLIQSHGRTWLVAGVGIFWLGIMLALTLSDYLTRDLAAL